MTVSPCCNRLFARWMRDVKRWASPQAERETVDSMRRPYSPEIICFVQSIAVIVSEGAHDHRRSGDGDGGGPAGHGRGAECPASRNHGGARTACPCLRQGSAP